MNPVNPLNHLLVVKIADIGDLLLTTPALEALRAGLPDARIDVLTTRHAAPILEHTGLADEVLIYEVAAFERLRDLVKPAALAATLGMARRLRARRYDAVLIFHQLSTRFGALKQAAVALATGAPRRLGLDNGRGWFLTERVPDLGFGARHQADYWLAVAALVGPQIDIRSDIRSRRLHIGIGQADREWARERLPDSRPYIALHPGSGGLNVARRWDADKFAAVADALIERQPGAAIVIVGGTNDNAPAVIAHMRHATDNLINLTGQTTLGQLAAVLERCEQFIGGDSGVMHIAAAIPHLRMVSLFGPTNAAAWGPWRPHAPESARVVHSPVLCSPCAYIQHSVGLRTGCEARTCMKVIPLESVLSAWETPPELPSENTAKPPALRVLGIPIHAVTFESLLERFATWLAEPYPNVRPRMVCTANPELIMIAQHDPLFYTILQRCTLVTADGVGLLWAARRLGHPLPERVTGSDGLFIIAQQAAQAGWRIFLLGAGPGVAEQAADALRARFAGLHIVGTYAGRPTAAEEDAIVALVNDSRADILFLAYGSPAQEKWIARNLPRLKVGVVMGVGGAFDFAAGITRRAPLWMRRAGIEWLHRLLRQPWRWRRMLRLPRFVWAVLRRGSRGPVSMEGKQK